jgi:DNA-binding IclR family transcriptional regulator
VHAEENELGVFPDKSLSCDTERTIVDPAEVRAELRRVRDQGFATCFEEHKLGFNAVAVPVADPQGKVIAALAALGPAYSMTHDKAMASLERLQAVSREITRKLE